MATQKHTRASKRLEDIRREWRLSGAQMGREMGVKQATVSRILNGLLTPGRDLIFSIQGLYFVPAGWWNEAPPAVESEPLPMRPLRYGTEPGGAPAATFQAGDVPAAAGVSPRG